MNDFLKGSVLALLASTAAFSVQAADLGSPGYQQSAPIIGSDPIRSDEFSGFFVGGQVGAAFSDVRKSRQSTFQNETLRFPNGLGLISPSFSNNPVRFKDESGFSVNGAVGYDVRLGDIVIGASLNVGYDDVRNRFDAVFANGFGGTAIARGSFEPNYNAGFRVRAGYVVLPQLLAYGFAGMGIQGVEYKAALPGSVFSLEETIPTWTVGAGMEYALGGGWALTGEYGYTRGMRHTVSTPFAVAQTSPVAGTTLRTDGLTSIKAETETHRVMAGVKYRFR